MTESDCLLEGTRWSCVCYGKSICETKWYKEKNQYWYTYIFKWTSVCQFLQTWKYVDIEVTEGSENDLLKTTLDNKDDQNLESLIEIDLKYLQKL